MELFWPVWERIIEFAVLVVLVWMVRKFMSRVSKKNQRLAQVWPLAQGCIEWATPKMIADGYWVGELAYSYSVQGKYYAGTFNFHAPTEDAAWRSVEGWKGRSITVRYSPSDPSQSVLVVDEQSPLASCIRPPVQPPR